jgi:hypothetical protein
MIDFCNTIGRCHRPIQLSMAQKKLCTGLTRLAQAAGCGSAKQKAPRRLNASYPPLQRIVLARWARPLICLQSGLEVGMS